MTEAQRGPGYVVQVPLATCAYPAEPTTLWCACCRQELDELHGYWMLVRGTLRWLCWGCIVVISPRQLRGGRLAEEVPSEVLAEARRPPVRPL